MVMLWLFCVCSRYHLNANVCFECSIALRGGGTIDLSESIVWNEFLAGSNRQQLTGGGFSIRLAQLTRLQTRIRSDQLFPPLSARRCDSDTRVKIIHINFAVGLAEGWFSWP